VTPCRRAPVARIEEDATRPLLQIRLPAMVLQEYDDCSVKQPSLNAFLACLFVYYDIIFVDDIKIFWR
jgi:hypothetical protein